jgi:arylsulfatase A-like enzyme
MSDTHFPWERTSLNRARELGFPNGLKVYEADAVLPSGQRNETYARYLQTITRMDAQVGEILDKLKEKGLYDDTLIVIVSDHGCQWWEHEHMYYVGHLYEQSLHVPMMIKAPGFPKGKVADAPVMQFDILPTLMEIAGIEQVHPRDDYPLPGRSLTPLMRGDTSQEHDASYRQRDLILTTHYDTIGVIHQFRHKLVFDRPSGTYWLFDLERDPGETNNLVDSEPELLEEMIGRLREMAAQNPAMIGRIRASEAMMTGKFDP